MNYPMPEADTVNDWRKAEANAVNWMKHWGFNDARATPAGADGGLDAEASGAVSQVKFQANPVGRPAIQQLVGAEMTRGREKLFFTSSSYAQPAIEYAAELDVALFTYDPFGRMTPVNGAARSIIRRGEQSFIRQVDRASYSIERKRPFRIFSLGFALLGFYLPINWLFVVDAQDRSPWWSMSLAILVSLTMAISLWRRFWRPFRSDWSTTWIPSDEVWAAADHALTGFDFLDALYAKQSKLNLVALLRKDSGVGLSEAKEVVELLEHLHKEPRKPNDRRQ